MVGMNAPRGPLEVNFSIFDFSLPGKFPGPRPPILWRWLPKGRPPSGKQGSLQKTHKNWGLGSHMSLGPDWPRATWALADLGPGSPRPQLLFRIGEGGRRGGAIGHPIQGCPRVKGDNKLNVGENKVEKIEENWGRRIEKRCGKSSPTLLGK